MPYSPTGPHEDDALRAVRAAAGMQAVLQRVNIDLQRATCVLANRTHHTGEVVANDDRPPSRSSRPATQSTSRPPRAGRPENEIYLGESTYRLVRDASSRAGGAAPSGQERKGGGVPPDSAQGSRLRPRADSTMLGREEGSPLSTGVPRVDRHAHAAPGHESSATPASASPGWHARCCRAPATAGLGSSRVDA